LPKAVVTKGYRLYLVGGSGQIARLMPRTVQLQTVSRIATTIGAATPDKYRTGPATSLALA
jgi:hypothetical protein